jgi:DNA-binding transcriptional MerR regulator
MTQAIEGLSIGQVAERFGLSVHALRFYEREGILADPIRRDSGGRRVYSEDNLDWLEMCLMLRATGMPLTAIRRYSDLVKEGDGNEQERVALLHHHEARVNEQIAQLHRCLDMIKYKLACYDEILKPPDATEGVRQVG